MVMWQVQIVIFIPSASSNLDIYHLLHSNHFKNKIKKQIYRNSIKKNDENGFERITVSFKFA